MASGNTERRRSHSLNVRKGHIRQVVLSQKAEKQLAMFSFVREKINHHILSYVVDSLCEVDDLLVLLMDASLALMTPRITAIASALSNGGCNKF